MHLYAKKHLYDINQAMLRINELTADASFEDYENDWVKRYAVERSFSIIGEALMRLRKFDPALTEMITDFPEIIAFRNQLVHGYDDIDNQEVWHIIQNELPILSAEVSAMLADR